jgi:hypothetical protein
MIALVLARALLMAPSLETVDIQIALHNQTELVLEAVEIEIALVLEAVEIEITAQLNDTELYYFL